MRHYIILIFFLLTSSIVFSQTVEQLGLRRPLSATDVLKLQEAFAYHKRGDDKFLLGDFRGAIADYTKAIEINPNNALAYSNRGSSKENLGDLNGACGDWKKAAALGKKIAAEWVAKQCN